MTHIKRMSELIAENESNHNTTTIPDDIEYKIFRALLRLYDMKYTKSLYQYYKNDCSGVFGNVLSGYELCSSKFELALMLCAILIEDKMTLDEFPKLGYKSYKGKNNPFDYAWFYEDLMDEIQRRYENDVKFNRGFKEFFELVKKCFDDESFYGPLTTDRVWEFSDILNEIL